MRIVLGFHEGVMLAMHRDPFARAHASDDPQPPTHRHTDRRMQRNAGVRHSTVHIDRGTHDREMARHDDEK